MLEFFVDIATSASTAGEGTRGTPYIWSQLVSSLSGTDYPDDVNWYLKGFRDVNGNLRVTVNDDGTHTYKLINWESSPWFLSASGDLEFSFGDINSDAAYKTPSEMYFVGGILIADSIEFEEVDSAQDRTLEFDNMWIEEI